MTVLFESDIRKYLGRSCGEDPLVITPLTDPKHQIGSCSVDVSLWNEFLITRRTSFGTVRISDTAVQSQIERYVERDRICFDERYVLHPRQFILGSTLEMVRIPTDLMCYVIGKSTWGRLGLIIATATMVSPGFSGAITLELCNIGDTPIELVPGMRIAQLVFHRCEEGSRSKYPGRYVCPTGPVRPIIKPSDFLGVERTHDECP